MLPRMSSQHAPSALFDPLDRGAELSPDGVYRYRLWRELRAPAVEGTVLFVMLNPSTADALVDDPTIRRCIGFAREWGYRRLEVANLFALRATDPKRLELSDGPVGPVNDEWLQRLSGEADLQVAAWGAHPFAVWRAEHVARLLRRARPIACLGTTRGGHPRHPLYVPAARGPVEWRP